MADDINPWSVEGWNLTAQAAYLNRFGQARAEARARDAGSVFGATKPPVKPTDKKNNPLAKFAPRVSGLPAKPPALTQPPKALGLYTDQLTDRQKRVLYFIRKKRRNAQDVSIKCDMDVGMGMAYEVKFGAPPMDMGFTFDFEASNLYREIDVVLNPGDLSFSASFRFGFDGPRTVFGGVTPIFPPPTNSGFNMNQPPIELAREIRATFDLGIDQIRAAFGNQREIDANIGMGFDESWLFNEYNHGVFDYSVGLDLSASLEKSKELAPINMGLGLTESATLERARELAPITFSLGLDVTSAQPNADVSAHMDMGFTEAAVIDVSTIALAANVLVGFDETPVVFREYELTTTYSVGLTQTTQQPAASITVNFDFGFTAVASIDTTFNLQVPFVVGASESATITRERDLVAANDVGFSVTSAQPNAEVAAAPTLGFNQAAQLDATIPAINMSLGFTQAQTIELARELSPTFDVGMTQTQFLHFERDALTDIHMGLDMVSGLQMDYNATVNYGLGAALAAMLYRETYQVANPALGVDLSAKVNAKTAAALSYVYQGSVDNTTANNSGTTTTVGIGFGAAPSSTRWILCTIGHSVGRTLNSASIGGTPATILVQAVGGRTAAIIVAKVPLGTSGNVVLSWSGINAGAVGLSVYSIDAPVGMSVSTAQTSSGTLSPTYGATINALAGSISFQCGESLNGAGGQDFTFNSGDIEDYDATFSGDARASASYTFDVDENRAYTASLDHSGTINAWCIVVLSPELDISATAAALGAAVSATVTTEVVTVIPSSGAAQSNTGFTVSAALGLERDLSATMALGASESATMSLIPANQMVTTFLGSQAAASATATQTFGTFSTTADANCYIVVAVYYGTAGVRLPSAVTIGGVSATRLLRAATITSRCCDLWYANYTAGGAINVVVSFNGNANNGAVGVWQLIGPLDVSGVGGLTGSGSGLSNAFTSKNGACGIAVACTTSGSTVTFTDPSSADFAANTAVATTYRYAGGHNAPLTAANWNENISVASGSGNFLACIFPPL